MSVLTVALLVFITVACLHAFNVYVSYVTAGAKAIVSTIVASVMIIAVIVVGLMALM